MSGEEKIIGNEKQSGPINMSSPYYLHPSDHPGMNICPVTLKGYNYEEWVQAMRNAFRAKRKLGFLDGHVPKPSDEETTIEVWWSVNSMLVAWIFQSIEQTLRSSITYHEDVKSLWDDLKQRFSIGNGLRIHQLRSDLARCKQDGQSVTTYFGRFKVLWDELTNYVQLPLCTCGKCTCNTGSKWNQQREEERVHQFLMGLDDVVYGTVRSNILAQELLLGLNRAYTLVIQEERLHNVARSREVRTDAVSFAAQGQRMTSSIVSEKCVHCGRTGHDKTMCFKIIGYPEWWGAGRGRGQQNGSRGTEQPMIFGTAGRERGNIQTTYGTINAARQDVQGHDEAHSVAHAATAVSYSATTQDVLGPMTELACRHHSRMNNGPPF